MLLWHVAIWAKRLFMWFSDNFASLFASETTLCLLFSKFALLPSIWNALIYCTFLLHFKLLANFNSWLRQCKIKRFHATCLSTVLNNPTQFYCKYSRGGWSHGRSLFRLRLRSCSKILESGSGNFSNLRIRLLFRLRLQSSIQP